MRNAGSRRYTKSEALLTRALKRIPLGSQTFSKSKTQFPVGVSPFFIQRGEGCHVWDVDGHEYIDFINGLCAITLGYNDPDVTEAVRTQLKSGVIFSLPHPLELEVAELITQMVPCAEMVRFGKNGSDATAGAIRLARAHTGRDHVAVCGYHGWQDWYIGSTARNLGVPSSTQALTHKFQYNDLDSLHAIFKEHAGQVAAVILEPMNVIEPKPGFLQEARELTHRHGALFIFDETITGFRFANGGAQEFFGITPDLATFGKGVANGFPVSVVAGPEKYMRLMEEIFFSFTFGGEALSLAAAKATLTKLRKKPVVKTLARQGEKVIQLLRKTLKADGLENVMSVSGHPSWIFLNLKDAEGYTFWEIKTLFLQETLARGILTFGTHNMSYTHSDKDLRRLQDVYREVFPILYKAIYEHKLRELLHCEPLQPLFRLR